MTLESPIGLVLAGGAAHGAWQAGALSTLVHDFGLEFDSVLGISAGSLTGSAYVVNRMPELLERWHNIDDAKILEFSPRMTPASLCSNEPIWRSVERLADDDWVRDNARCRFTVVSLCYHTRAHVYGRFDPNQGGPWTGPLRPHIVASCSMPYIFPPVPVDFNGESRLLIDGGAHTSQPISFTDLGHCRTVIILQTNPPKEEPGLSDKLKQRFLPGRFRANDTLVEDGIASLKALRNPPQIIRFYPLSPLPGGSLAFRSDACQQALAQGQQEARLFWRDSARFVIPLAA